MLSRFFEIREIIARIISGIGNGVFAYREKGIQGKKWLQKRKRLIILKKAKVAKVKKAVKVEKS